MDKTNIDQSLLEYIGFLAFQYFLELQSQDNTENLESQKPICATIVLKIVLILHTPQNLAERACLMTQT